MDFKALKWQILRGSFGWRLVIRALLFMLALFIVSFTRICNDIENSDPITLQFDKCSLSIGSGSVVYANGKNLSVGVAKEVMRNQKLTFESKALCLGDESGRVMSSLQEFGFLNVFSVYKKNPLLSLFNKQFEFESNSFDFVFSTNLNWASVPSISVLEIERLLVPGGVGAMLVGSSSSFINTRSLVRSATPVSLLLRSSEILHVCGIDSYTLIVFKKQLVNVALFDNYKLPNECPSILKNKPFMEYIEPLVDQMITGTFHELYYLPKFLNVSSRNRLIYINMGAGEFDRRYPIHPDAFNVYVVDHNVSSLTSHVKKPGVTFVYHPGLVENDNSESESSLMSADYLEAPLHEEQFEFIDWFKETAKDGDFVVLMMNAGTTQLKVLFELFASGAICHVDELFLRCSDGVDCKSGYCKDCMSLYNGLRNAGVFVHQWLGD